MIYTWRVWQAFERKYPATDFGRALANSCRLPSGRVDMPEFERWLDLLTEHYALWGRA